MRSSHNVKKPTNLSIDQNVLAEARKFGINLSRAAEAGVRQALADANAELWKQQNLKAIESSNDWVEVHGLPLDRYRRF